MNPQELWQRTLAELFIVVNETSLTKQWLLQSQGLELQNNVLKIACPHFYIRELLIKKHKDAIEEILQRLTQEKIKVELVIQPLKTSTTIAGPLFDQAPKNTPVERTEAVKPLNALGLNPSLVFENFVVGSCNRIAHAAALSITEAPGQIYNPLFIFGGTGLGKTHLLHAIGNELTFKNPNLRIRYFTSEKFVNSLVEAIRFKKDLREFRASFRLVDVSLVDDVQFLGGKDSSQEEFYHTFNELQASGSQVVLASDRAPKEINQLDDRLASRFMGGLLLQMGLPDFETRLAIIKTKAESLDVILEDEIANFLAQNTSENIREIGGLIQKIKAYHLLNQPVTLQSVQKLFGKEREEQVKNKNITPDAVISLIAQNFNTSLSELCAKNRKKEIVLPRQLTMYILRKELNLGLEEIGQTLGGRDHSTVLHAVARIEQKLKQNNSFIRTTIQNLKSSLFV